MAFNGSLPDSDDHDFFDPEYAYDFYNRAYANDFYEENQPGPATQDKCPGTSSMQYMDWHLLKACSTGNLAQFKHLTRPNHADAMLSTTPLRNNCLHIAAMFGHRRLAKEIWSTAPSLLCDDNEDGETPLIAALMSANKCLASDMIDMIAAAFAENSEGGMDLQEMLLRADRRGETALHHAIRNGFDELAVQLLNIEPRLSNEVEKSVLSGTKSPSSEQPDTQPPSSEQPGTRPPNELPLISIINVGIAAPANESAKYKAACRESAMYMAARRGSSKVVKKLLEIKDSAHSGGRNQSALHAAVRFGQPGIVKQLLKGRPRLACSADNSGETPLLRAVFHNNIDMVKIFLEHDPYLAYIRNKETGETPFFVAALVGSVEIAEKIRKACPDSVYTPDKEGKSALHIAIELEQPHFVHYVLQTPELFRLINQTSNDGSLPLHLAAARCNTKILHSLLRRVGHDYTAVDVFASNAVNKVYGNRSASMTIEWKMKEAFIKNLDQLTEKYTSSTIVVAALNATITFTAAFTLPGGLSNDPSDPSDNGLPVLAKRAAFQAFLISDTIAMCCSLAAAYLCIMSRWEDKEIVLNYMRITRLLMWCAFRTTLLAFGTGLFVVMAPSHLLLSILILIPCIILPLTTAIMGKWPILMLRYRLRGKYRKDIMPHI